MTENNYIKLLIAGSIILLIGAMFGFMNPHITIFRWDILAMCVTLAGTALATRRYFWAGTFFIFGAIFNPIVPLSLDKETWIAIDVILAALFLAWFWDYFTNYHKGLLFEKYILNKFPDAEWVLVNNTKDLHKKLRRFVESDSNPDFVFRKRATGKVIAVECKYRSTYFEHKKWGIGVSWKKEQGERYAKYGRDNNIPVYIALGVGGNPKSPKTTAFLPIELIQKQYYLFIPKDIIERNQSIQV